jgi:hypothetical protein
MIQVTAQMRLVVALDPVDGRLGIDGLGRVCRSVLDIEPLDGTLVAFRSRSGKTLRLLVYDGLSRDLDKAEDFMAAAPTGRGRLAPHRLGRRC